jgi:hypothetical protein
MRNVKLLSKTETKPTKDIWRGPPDKNKRYMNIKQEMQTNYAGGKRGQL